MTTYSVRIVADDLTGALDALASFRGAREPRTVVLQEQALKRVTSSAALSTARRDSAIDRVAFSSCHVSAFLRNADVQFLKVDSGLRGNPAQDVAEFSGLGDFGRVIVAPAFPDQGRTLRHGIPVTLRGEVRSPETPGRNQEPPALLERLLVLGLDAELLANPSDIRTSSAKYVVVDAESNSDLLRVVEEGLRTSADVLWVGSAGLARALAHTLAGVSKASYSTDISNPLLMIVASDSATTMRQLTTLRATGITDEVQFTIGELADELFSRVHVVAATSQAVVISFRSRNRPTKADANEYIRSTLKRLLAELPRPKTVFISGGWTMATVCELLQTEQLDVSGEFSSGIPLSRMTGGRWEGVQVISKSGGFGGPTSLVEMARSATGKTDA